MGMGDDILPIFQTPLYKEWHFPDLPIQKMGFLRPPYTNQMAFSRPPYTKNGLFETSYSKKFNPYTKNGRNLTPPYKNAKI